jgi:hypothetical protein
MAKVMNEVGRQSYYRHMVDPRIGRFFGPLSRCGHDKEHGKVHMLWHIIPSRKREYKWLWMTNYGREVVIALGRFIVTKQNNKSWLRNLYIERSLLSDGGQPMDQTTNQHCLQMLLGSCPAWVVTDTKLVSEDLQLVKWRAAREQERAGRDLVNERRDLRQEYLMFLYN